MGLMSGLFGGVKKGYESPYTSKDDTGLHQMLGNRAGARSFTDAKGNQQWDWSKAGGAVTPTEAGSGYDWSGYDKAGASADTASAGYNNPYKFTQEYSSGYKPQEYSAFKFDYGKLPSEYAKTAYESGASDIRRESQGSLEKLRETIGTRRPGLLMKAGQDSQRNAAENLSRMNSSVRMNEMDKNLEYGRAQQDAQAGENARSSQMNDAMQQYLSGEKFREYGSKADLETKNAAEKQANLAGMRDTSALYGNLAQSKIGQQAGITADERAYKDKVMDYLMSLYGQGSQQSQFNAQQTNEHRKSVMGTIASAAGTAAKAYTGGVG